MTPSNMADISNGASFAHALLSLYAMFCILYDSAVLNY